MPRRAMGHTGQSVSVLGYGSMELRGPPRGRALDEARVGALLNRVLDTGIDLVDTSIDYGIAEERIGRHIGHRRDEFFLASKCGCAVGWQPASAEDRSPHDFTRDTIVRGVEQSLARLRTDHLDLVQVHASPSRTVLEACDVIETLVDLREQGKTRFIGMSGTQPHLADHVAMGVFDVFQVPYSIVEREHDALMRRIASAGAGVIVRGGVAKGTPSGDERPVRRHARLADIWRRAGLADELGVEDPMELTLRFTISHPAMTSTIVGTASEEHLERNVAAARRGPLPDDLMAALTDRLDRADVGDVN